VPALEQRLPFDPAKARALLKEAGYANGFAVTLDCVNVTYRAAVCQAIAAMLTQVGIRVTFQPSPSSLFFPKLTQATRVSSSSAGRRPPTSGRRSTASSAHGTARAPASSTRPLFERPGSTATIDAIRVEPDLGKRRAPDRQRAAHDERRPALVPLYRRTLTWVMRPNIDVVQWPSDVLELRWVRLR